MNLGVRREDKNEWERRVPLVPSDVAKLVDDKKLNVIVQPSKIRAFDESAYENAGASISEDISNCNVVFAVKEIPMELFRKDGAYVFFSHTIKGQSCNMPMLQKLMDLQCTLIDYELLVDSAGRRLVYFGSFAGEVGLMDSLWALGRRLSSEGQESVFSRMKQTLEHGTLEAALSELSKIGDSIRTSGIPTSLAPFVVGFMGYGNVSLGAQEALGMLPVREVKPSELPSLFQSPNPITDCIFKVVFKEEDMAEPKDSEATFDLQHYFKHPSEYKSKFEQYLPYLTVLVNCIYWSKESPHFVSKEGISRLFSQDNAPRLRVIGDVSCDVGGGIEITAKSTDIGNPVFVYNPDSGQVSDGVEGKGPVIFAVDNMPAEVPIDASKFFSNALLAYVEEIAIADYSVDFSALCLSETVKNAVILHRGKLTPKFKYLEEFL